MIEMFSFWILVILTIIACSIGAVLLAFVTVVIVALKVINSLIGGNR